MAALEVLALNTTTPQIIAGQAGDTYTFPRAITGTVPLGVAGTSLGALSLSGNTSGTVTVQPAAAAGTWTLTLPTSGGTNTYALLTNGSGATSWGQIAIGSAVSGLGTGVATALAVNVGSAGAFVTLNGALGTPSSGTLTNATGLPISTGVSGLGTGIATWLGTPSSANLASAVTDETGSGALVFGTSPTISTKLTLTGATETTSNPVLDMTQTWNAGAVTFTGVKLNVTNTASAAASLLMDLQLGGSSVFAFGKGGVATFAANSQIIMGSNVNIDSSNNGRLAIYSAGSIGFGASTVGSSSALDTALYRDAAATFAMRNGTTATALRVYNTYTDASNYERGVFDWGTTANTLTIGVQAAGTGTAARNINFVTGGSTFMTITGSSGLVTVAQAFLAGAGSFYCSPSTYNARMYNAGQFAWTNNANANLGTEDTGLARSAAGIIKVTNGSTGGGSLEMQEVTAPSAGATNIVRIYAEDNGAGKTRLMALFATGAAQQIAIEP